MSTSDSTASFTVRQIHDLESFAPKKEQTKSALALAFEKDPAIAVVTNHDKEFYGDFVISTIIAGLLAGEVYLAEDQNENVLGAAVWFPPGREMYDSEDQQQQALSVLIGRFTTRDPALWEWWETKYIPQYGELTTSLLGDGVKRRSWHLQTLGVAPEHQQKGIAKALINVIKEKVSKDGANLCLETTTEINVSIYKRLGFTSKGNTTIKGAGGEFTMWVLSQEVPKA
ncbi:hypothetical protein M422DRAFT_247748 [Sphaerobolus stellatus SS14]|nr:hypothetical protein M422DRAFT_247748 [Sphaerobolus stellatus SS14]